MGETGCDIWGKWVSLVPEHRRREVLARVVELKDGAREEHCRDRTHTHTHTKNQNKTTTQNKKQTKNQNKNDHTKSGENNHTQIGNNKHKAPTVGSLERERLEGEIGRVAYLGEYLR